jgi:hypothetical protein
MFNSKEIKKLKERCDKLEDEMCRLKIFKDTQEHFNKAVIYSGVVYETPTFSCLIGYKSFREYTFIPTINDKVTKLVEHLGYEFVDFPAQANKLVKRKK